LRLQHSDYFTVRVVRVSGTSSIDPALIANLSGVWGKPLYAVDPSSSAATIDRLPVVAGAQVRRVWPNEVDILIHERTPWGTWQIGGVNYVIDGDGVVLDIAPTPWPASIYELDAAPGKRPGDRVDGDAVRMAAVLLDRLPNTMSQQVLRMEYAPDSGLDLVTNQNIRVRLGDSQGLEYKFAVWQALNFKVGASRIHLIDLSSVDRPYFR
jgi:cell division protein FtsQ